MELAKCAKARTNKINEIDLVKILSTETAYQMGTTGLPQDVGSDYYS